jgi:Fic family protein
MSTELQIISKALLEDFKKNIHDNLSETFEKLTDAEISTESFSFYTSVSSVFSSKIEGENIELDSYIKHKKFGIEFLPNYTKKIDDLYGAYTFAKYNKLNEENISEAHKLLSKHIIAIHSQGKVRTQNMYVSTPDGKIEYVAATPFEVPSEMTKFYHDINILLKLNLTIEETFYFAAMIHLVFVKIHPWNDGNGRSARLIEKWFLGQKLGDKAWFIQSEKNYYQNHQTYYKNIRLLGLEYSKLDYLQSLPFLLMLPNSLNISN